MTSARNTKCRCRHIIPLFGELTFFFVVQLWVTVPKKCHVYSRNSKKPWKCHFFRLVRDSWRFLILQLSLWSFEFSPVVCRFRCAMHILSGKTKATFFFGLQHWTFRRPAPTPWRTASPNVMERYGKDKAGSLIFWFNVPFPRAPQWCLLLVTCPTIDIWWYMFKDI